MQGDKQEKMRKKIDEKNPALMDHKPEFRTEQDCRWGEYRCEVLGHSEDFCRRFSVNIYCI